MTIGRRQTSGRSSIRAPKFLDKSSGFYGRLDEPDAAAGHAPPKAELTEDAEMFHEDDGETLLRRKPSRRSSRWRSLRRRGERGLEGGAVPEVIVQVQLPEPLPLHQDADDQVLIRDGAVWGPEEEGPEGEGPEGEGPEEERGRREQEDGIKALKRKSSKNYRQALDRALRRGWESFIANLYSVTLTPATPTTPVTPVTPEPDSSPSAKKRQRSRVLAELH